MNKYLLKYVLCTVLLSTILCPKHSLADDSISIRQLDEIVVMGDKGWIENGIINFIPSKKEKNLSNSPATLIKSMHIPLLKENGDNIVDMSGDIIPVFINGERADAIDLSTFWPNEVLRVQYIQNPSDPRYGGAEKAINFIMVKREFGGVTKLDLFQRVPNNGIYSASSKFVYKRMTYGVMLRGNYLRDHRSTMSGNTTYSDLFYNNKKYDMIETDENISSYTREDGMQVALNAKYTTNRFLATHTLSLGWTRNPGSGSHSINSWNHNLFGSSETSDHTTARTLSPQFSGHYYYRFSDKWFLGGLLAYSYATNKTSSWSEYGDCEPVINFSDEYVNSCKISVYPSFVLSSQWMFQLLFSSDLDWYSTRYSGSANIKQTQSRQEVSTSLSIKWFPHKKLSFSVAPGFATSLWQIGNIRQKTSYPTFRASINWNPARKLNINGSLKYYMRTPSASESNPVMVKSSELLWIVGNPYLKNLTSWNTYVFTTYLTNNWLNLTCGLGYAKTYDSLISVYDQYSPELGGLIKRYINSPSKDWVNANIGISGSFLDDNLSIDITPEWYHMYTRGTYKNKLSYFSLSASADYTIGNFRIEVAYQGPVKDMDNAGMEESWIQDKWEASVVYGTNNLYVQFKVEDIFHNKSRSWTKFNSPHYSYNYNKYETGRAFRLSLSYTFGYGKKVDKSIDISGPEKTKTSVINPF